RKRPLRGLRPLRPGTGRDRGRPLRPQPCRRTLPRLRRRRRRRPELLTRAVDRLHQRPDGCGQPATAGPQRRPARRTAAAQHPQRDPRADEPVRLQPTLGRPPRNMDRRRDRRRSQPPPDRLASPEATGPRRQPNRIPRRPPVRSPRNRRQLPRRQPPRQPPPLTPTGAGPPTTPALDWGGPPLRASPVAAKSTAANATVRRAGGRTT